MPLNIERIRQLTAEAAESGALKPITDAQADEIVTWMTPAERGSVGDEPQTD